MNAFLNHLLETIAINVNHLNLQLSFIEINYLDRNLKSKNDFDGEFYTNENGDNLEVLLHFLTCHKNEINIFLNAPEKSEILINLYTSGCISGNYDCFRFDLSKFDKTYKSKSHLLKLYRVGRDGEGLGNLGNSWSTSLLGLKNYCLASSIDVSNRPVFSIEISDCEVLFNGNQLEHELVLKPGFNFINFELLDNNGKREIFI